MAEILSHQPIIFDQEADCWLEASDLKVLAQNDDVTQFQMKLAPCMSDVELLTSGNFSEASDWTLNAGWKIVNGVACHSLGVGSTMSQVAAIGDGVYVRIQFTLDISQGSCTVTYGSYQENFTASGTYERYFTADSAAIIYFYASGSSAVCVSNASAYTINTNFEVYVVDEDGTTQHTYTSADAELHFAGGYLTASIDWTDIAVPEGCYTLQVFDPCPCSQGGIIPLDFRSGVQNWTVGTNWTFSGNGSADFSGSTSSESNLDHVLCADTTYTVTYTLKYLTGNGEFRVRLGSTLGTLRTADGIYTEDITANSTGFFMRGSSSGGAATFSIQEMSIEIADKTATYVSNVVKYQEEFTCRTLALALCNDSDGLGFGFVGTGFRPLMRISASLNRSSYPMKSEAYDNSQGRLSVYYARSRKARELGFDGVELMHDFAHLFSMADHFYIDDTEYAVEDREYPTVSWGEFDDAGGVSIAVSVKTQLIENRRLSSASVGCTPDGNEILDNFQEEILDEEHKPITDG